MKLLPALRGLFAGLTLCSVGCQSLRASCTQEAIRQIQAGKAAGPSPF